MSNPRARTISVATRGLLALSAALVLVGCSSGEERPIRPSPSVASEENEAGGAPTARNTPASPVDSSPPTTEVSQTIVCSPDGPPLTPFTGSAVSRFGAEAVMDAYCESAAFFVQHSITNLTDPATADPHQAASDLRFVADRLTVGGAQRWNRLAVKAGTSANAERALSDLTFYRMGLPAGYAYPADGPVAVGGTVSKATADVTKLPDGRAALALWYSVRLSLPVTKAAHGRVGEATHLLPLTRNVALYLVPNADPHADPDESWQIESWTTSWEQQAAEPRGAGR